MGLRVAVALGAGGARGYAHVGALQVLAERGHEVVAIAGTSMGSLVGGVAAAGKLEEYTEWALSLTQREVWRLLDMNLIGAGAIRGDRVIAKVAEILQDAQIEDCTIPFTAVATDLDNRREVWFQQGPIASAIRASSAIPGLISPVIVGNRVLVDGGLMNPVPIEPTAATMSDFTLAVSLVGRRRERLDHSTSPTRPESWTDTLAPITESWRAVASRLSSLWSDEPGAESATESAVESDAAPVEVGPGPVPAPAATPEPPPRDLTSVEVFNRSFDTMAALITRYRMAANPPDVHVSVPSDACKTMDFHRAAELIELGRELTTAALDAAGY